jgi:hypothetical protein
MKWLLTEIAILLISVFILVTMLIVIAACLPFSAIWSLCVDDDGGNDDVGLNFDERRNHWVASAGKSKAYCRTKEEAVTQRDRLRKENGFHENHGKEKLS